MGVEVMVGIPSGQGDQGTELAVLARQLQLGLGAIKAGQALADVGQAGAGAEHD